MSGRSVALTIADNNRTMVRPPKTIACRDLTVGAARDTARGRPYSAACDVANRGGPASNSAHGWTEFD
jgi:hypothetical protein